jgi:group I intron endonuclease
MKNDICGIYCIENLINKKKYIGQSFKINTRYSRHKWELNKNKERNKYLQNSWNKYGKESFKFYTLIETVNDRILLNKLEKFYINYMHSHISENGYNISWGGDVPNLNRKMSEESKLKLSLSKKGKKRPPRTKEWTENFIKSNIGKTRTEDCKRKMSERTKGENNPFYGKKHSEETKKKMSEQRIGNTYNKNKLWQIDQKERKSITNQGKKNKFSATSKYVGVCWNRNKNKWQATIKKNKKCYNLGMFLSEEEAALAYNKKAIELYGENANINIIL